MIAELIDPIAEIARVIRTGDSQKAQDAIMVLDSEKINVFNKDDALMVLHFCLVQEGEKYLSLFIFLTKQGISVFDYNNEGRSAFDIAAAAKKPIAALMRVAKAHAMCAQPIRNILYGNGDEKSILYQGLEEGDRDALELSILILEDFSKKNIDGLTLLELLSKNQPNSLQKLLRLSIDLGKHASQIMSPLISSGACPLKLNEEGLSVVHVAAMHNDPIALKQILCAAPDRAYEMLRVKTQEEEDTLLHCAAKKNSHEVLRYLLELFGANTLLNELTNAAGRNALHEAVIHNAREATQCLLAMPCFHGNILIKVPPAYPSRKEEGWSVAHYAAFYGADRVLQHLVKAGVSFSGLSPLGDSALMIAIGACNFSLVSPLLEVVPEMADVPNKAGVKPIRLLLEKIVLNNGLKLIAVSREEGYVALKLLVEKINISGHDDFEFCVRAAISDACLLEILFKAGLSPNAQLNKMPLLHLAAQAGSRAAVLLLCEYGADLDAKNPDGQKACDVASMPLIFEDLLKKMRNREATLQHGEGENPASESCEWRGFVPGFSRKTSTPAATPSGSSNKKKLPAITRKPC